jgi:phosphoribosylformylglycinamidine synthase
MSFKFGIIRFPGSNCEHDCYDVATRVLGCEAVVIDYRHQAVLSKLVDCVIIPGGFSFGDYLRAGAIAKASPVMPSVEQFAHQGGLVLGICNGFQVLTECGLLPGTLLNNNSGRFICQDASLLVKNNTTPFTGVYSLGEQATMPIAHAMGNYYIDQSGYEDLKANKQIVFEYADNPNGSVANIAGVCNKNKNVLGLMPHPERCCESILGGVDGLKLFESILKSAVVA